MSNETAPYELLTESEVAEMLRCSQSKIKRLRNNGKLAFLPGRPVLIELAAVDAYLKSIRREAHALQPPSEPTQDQIEAIKARVAAARAKPARTRR